MILALPLSVFGEEKGEYISNKRITHGVSVSYVSLPFVNNNWDNETDTYKGNGLGLNYELSLPVFQTRFRIITGLGITDVLYKEKKNETYTLIATDIHNVTTSHTITEENTDKYSFKKRCIEYLYASVPVKLGFCMLDKNDFFIMPYAGVSMKYNLKLVYQQNYNNNSFYDYYLSVFEDSFIKGEPQRFIIKYVFGLQTCYKNVYTTISYTKDSSKIFDQIIYRPDSKRAGGVNGPNAMNSWQIGLGYKF